MKGGRSWLAYVCSIGFRYSQLSAEVGFIRDALVDLWNKEGYSRVPGKRWARDKMRKQKSEESITFIRCNISFQWRDRECYIYFISMELTNSKRHNCSFNWCWANKEFILIFFCINVTWKEKKSLIDVSVCVSMHTLFRLSIFIHLWHVPIPARYNLWKNIQRIRWDGVWQPSCRPSWCTVRVSPSTCPRPRSVQGTQGSSGRRRGCCRSSPMERTLRKCGCWWCLEGQGIIAMGCAKARLLLVFKWSSI